MTRVLMTFLLLGNPAAWAGGDSWAFRVRSVTPTGTGHHLVLVPAEASYRFRACTTVVSVEFRPTQWTSNSADAPCTSDQNGIESWDFSSAAARSARGR
jgi:hypothetical protein